MNEDSLDDISIEDPAAGHHVSGYEAEDSVDDDDPEKAEANRERRKEKLESFAKKVAKELEDDSEEEVPPLNEEELTRILTEVLETDFASEEEAQAWFEA